MEKRKVQAHRDFAALEVRRMRAAALFRQGKSRAEVARILQVSRQSTSNWFAAWEKQGRRGLKGAGRAGRKPKLGTKELRRLERSLLRGPQAFGYPTELWTLERIAYVIEESFHVHYHPGHVWKILRQLGWSCQRPVRRAKERDEALIRRWIRVEWPRIKKKQKNWVLL